MAPTKTLVAEAPPPDEAGVSSLRALPRSAWAFLVVLTAGGAVGSMLGGLRVLEVIAAVGTALGTLALAFCTFLLARQTAETVRASQRLEAVAREQHPTSSYTTSRDLTAADVQQQLRAVTRDIGIPLVAGWSASPARQHGHWMHRRGLTLQAL